jgi:hypothetical protein
MLKKFSVANLLIIFITQIPANPRVITPEAIAHITRLSQVIILFFH